MLVYNGGQKEASNTTFEFKYRFKTCNKAILMVYEETLTNFKANQAGDCATRSEGFYNKTDAFVSISDCTTLSEYIK